MYIGAQRNILNIGTKEDFYDIKIGQEFVQRWRKLQTGASRKHRKSIYDLTQAIKDIFEYKDLTISASEDNQTLQVDINGQSFRLPELGSGIGQFILVLANAVIKRPSFILIDEPESNLHPSLQLEFLTALTSYSSEGTFFATHNFGLAQASAEYLYTINKTDNGMSEISPYVATPRLSEMLGELSYSGYKELGFDKVLLVEGSSELKVIQQFLRFYGKAHKIVLLHLGGNNLIHGSADIQLEEITRIAPGKVYALIDSEKDEADAPLPNDRAQFIQLCERVNIPCYVLARRALENYFSDRAIKVAISGDRSALGPYEALNQTIHWKKKNDWRIAHEMTREEIGATDLGLFLNSL